MHDSTNAVVIKWFNRVHRTAVVPHNHVVISPDVSINVLGLNRVRYPLSFADY